MRILLALDDSKCSAGATDALIAQAKTKNAEVRVLHVVEPFPESLAKRMGSRAFTRLRRRAGGAARAGRGNCWREAAREASLCWLQGDLFQSKKATRETSFSTILRPGAPT